MGKRTAIVVTRSAAMPSSCRGRYRKVYVVVVPAEEAATFSAPVDARTRRITILWDSGPRSVGKTARSAYARAMLEAETMARDYNAERASHGRGGRPKRGTNARTENDVVA